MAVFKAFTKFDATRIEEIGNENEDLYPLHREEIEGGYRVSDDNGHEVELLGTLITDGLGLSFVEGKINSVTQTNDGHEYFSFTGLDHDINVDFYDAGYNVDGKILYGFQAETAYWLSGNDTLNGSGSGDVLSGYKGNDAIYGNGGADVLNGWSGNDKLFGGSGNDKLLGGKGSDILNGGLGTDRLYGGAGDNAKDTFDFNLIADSIKGTSRDKIYDFVSGIDKIDLKGIDANTSIEMMGDQAFEFNKTTAKANSIWFKMADVDGDSIKNDLILYGDVDGNLTADFEIGLVGVTKLVSTDFIL